MKRCSTSLVFREMQIKATGNTHTTRMAKIERCDGAKYRQACGGHYAVVQLLSRVDSSQPQGLQPTGSSVREISQARALEWAWRTYGPPYLEGLQPQVQPAMEQKYFQKIQTAPKDKLEFATQQQIFMQHSHHIYNYLHSACIYIKYHK